MSRNAVDPRADRGCGVLACCLLAVLLIVSSFAASAQVYARFGSKLEPEFDPRKFSPSDLSPELPACKRNDALWWKQIQGGNVPSLGDWPVEWRKTAAAHAGGQMPVFGAHQGVTWIDVDGDGWCDALVSVQPEAEKRPGLPIIVTDASSLLFFDPATQTFHGGKRGLYTGISNDGEIDSAFTFYFNKVARRVEVDSKEAAAIQKRLAAYGSELSRSTPPAK